MMELTMNEQVYQFNFGMGFLREVNKRATVQADGIKGAAAEKNVGLRMMVAGLIDEDVETLVDVLDAANKGMTPRATKSLLDKYIDDSDTDIDALFDEVMDFLKQGNATKKTTLALLTEVEEAKANQN